MKVKVDNNLCQGHARCFSIAPDIFELDDSGYIMPGDILVPEGQEEIARRGVCACPERALSIEGEEI